jgi:threonine synthase
MVTQEGGNVAVIAVKGNFDDTQNEVKKIFNDKQYAEEIARKGFKLSSANSINWGRLLPQMVYYFSAYSDLVKAKRITSGQQVNFVVPTGNFGNILAGYYAKLMGLPINRLICAANSNNVLTDFLRTGLYDRRREFHKTLSPSMDILISSNLERLLYLCCGEKTDKVAGWMSQLHSQGYYQVNADCLQLIQETFWSDWADDNQTSATTKAVYQQKKYLLDPHTAVAWRVYEKYRAVFDDPTPTVIISTASPFKFNESVLTAIADQTVTEGGDEFDSLRQLSQITGWPVPAALAGLEGKIIRHQAVCEKDQMVAEVDTLLKGRLVR